MGVGCGSSINPNTTNVLRTKTPKFIDIIDNIIGIHAYKVYIGNISKVIENHYSKDHIHYHTMRQIDRIHNQILIQIDSLWLCGFRELKFVTILFYDN